MTISPLFGCTTMLPLASTRSILKDLYMLKIQNPVYGHQLSIYMTMGSSIRFMVPVIQDKVEQILDFLYHTPFKKLKRYTILNSTSVSPVSILPQLLWNCRRPQWIFVRNPDLIIVSLQTKFAGILELPSGLSVC